MSVVIINYRCRKRFGMDWRGEVMLNWYETESGVSCMVNAVQWSVTFVGDR